MQVGVGGNKSNFGSGIGKMGVPGICAGGSMGGGGIPAGMRGGILGGLGSAFPGRCFAAVAVALALGWFGAAPSELWMGWEGVPRATFRGIPRARFCGWRRCAFSELV
jgi:hypothetical protein